MQVRCCCHQRRDDSKADTFVPGSSSYRRGVNSWSDLTQAEWEEQYLGGYKHIAVDSHRWGQQGNFFKFAPENISISHSHNALIAQPQLGHIDKS